MTATEKGYAVFPFAAAYGGKRMQPFLFTARRGEVKEHALSHAGEEFVMVLEGEIRFRVGPTDYHMRPGDSLYFDAREPHGMLPVTATARYLDIFL
jgi:quercetin dioxygenase-like cupin family protein